MSRSSVWLERLPDTQCVVGSNPIGTTNFKEVMVATKKMVVTRHSEDLRTLDYKSLTYAIAELQSIADRPDCNPDEAIVELEYSRGYYDDIDGYINIRWEHTREETDKEQEKRLAAAKRARETKKRNKKLALQKEIELRDELLKKHPL